MGTKYKVAVFKALTIMFSLKNNVIIDHVKGELFGATWNSSVGFDTCSLNADHLCKRW